MKSLKLLFTLLFASVIALSCTNREKQTDEAIQAIMDKYHTPGVQAVIVKDNKIVYSKAFGYRNLEEKLPLRTTDYMRIASISKSFTATALMQLVEEGKVSLDDDVSDLIGFTVRNPHHPDVPITLRMILSHTSSIKDQKLYNSLDFINPAVNGDCAESYYDYAPGEEYNYSNLGLNFAGTILEKVTNVRFDECVYERVIKPLGLYANHNNDFMDPERRTTLYKVAKDGTKFTPQTKAYLSRKDDMDKYIMGYSAPWFSPTGGVKISAEDLAKYMMMHMNYGEYNGVRIISEESSKLMQTPVNEAAGYGLCLFTNMKQIEGLSLKGHTGSANGLKSIMIFHPEEKWGIVAMCSGLDLSKGEIRGELADAIYKAYFK